MTLKQPFHVGFSYFEQPFLWKLVAHELTEIAEQAGVRVTAKGARSVTDQVKAVQALVDAGANALVIAPIVPEIPPLLPLLTKARSRGVVALLLGLELHGAESLPIVRGDTAAVQVKIAELVFQHLEGTGKVAYIRALGDSVPNIRRAKAFHQVLGCYPGIQLVQDIVRDWTPLQVRHGVAPMGAVWAEQILKEHPNVRAILAPSDNVALGVIDFLQRKNIAGKIIVTGFDATPAGLKAVEQGLLFATVALPARDIAHRLLDSAVALIKKENVSSQTLLPVTLVTRDNAAAVMASTVVPSPEMIEMQW